MSALPALDPGAARRPVPAMLPWADPFFTVGVTGTNGKTSTTFLVAAAMRAAGHGVLRETTIGYALDERALDVRRGLHGYVEALSAAARAGARHAAIEVTSHALSRGWARTWRCDLAVFTNLTRDHLEAHGSWERYLASKAQLFLWLGPGRAAVLNAADPAALLLDRITPPDVRRVWYAAPSRGPRLRPADLVADEVEISAAGTRARLAPSPLADALGGALEVPLVGEVFAENALAAAAAALSAGIAGDAVRAGLGACPPVPGRFEIVARDPIVAIDYAHTPDALARTCDAARRLSGGGRVAVVFGAGGGADRGKREPMGEVVGARADLAVLTSDNPRDEDPAAIAGALAAGCRRAGRAEVVIELDRRRAVERALEGARPGDVVVLAGKGHEEGQAIGGETLPWSERAEALRALGRSEHGTNKDRR